MPIDLTQFSGAGNFAPFSRGEHSYATNGHIAVRVARRDDIAENDEAPRAENAFRRAEASLKDGAVSIPNLPSIPSKRCNKCKGCGKVTKCLECSGNGFQECDLGHEHDCEECDGSGVLSARNESDASRHLSCEECDGAGHVPTADNGRGVFIVFPGEHIVQLRYLRKIKALPGVRWRLDGRKHEDPIPFWFEGGDGLLMPCRHPAGNASSCIYIEDSAQPATNGT